MGLGDFILMVDKLGVFGLVLSVLFVTVMFIGSVVDITQFWWRVKRYRARRKRALYNKIRSQVLLELHEHAKR